MTNEERIQVILSYLTDTPYVTVNDLAGLNDTLEVAINAMDWTANLSEDDVDMVGRIKVALAYLRSLLRRL